MKLIAEQSFNPLAPSAERVKMFIIHIRNYVKMHYQISLTTNFSKKLIIETQSNHKSASPTRVKNNSYKSLSRANSINKKKITEILHNNWMSTKKNSNKESPVIPQTQLVGNQKINKLFSLNSTRTNDIVTEKKHLNARGST